MERHPLDCANSYDGADGVLRCRVHTAGQACTEKVASLCNKFALEPFIDCVEAWAERRILCPDAWCR